MDPLTAQAEISTIMLTPAQLSSTHRKEYTLPAKDIKLLQPTNSWLECKEIQNLLEDRKSILQAERVDKWSSRSCAIWFPDKRLAEVTRRVGKQWQSIGFERGSTLLLHPEEALYLVETNLLELLLDGVAVSVQQAYSLLLGPHCTLPEYRTYAALQRCGLVVLRHKELIRSGPSGPSVSGTKRSHDTESEPPKKRPCNDTKKADIEVIDLEEDEGLEFVPPTLGKDCVSVTVAPSHLLPPGAQPQQAEYTLQLGNLSSPGVGARAAGAPPRLPPPNFPPGFPWQTPRAPLFNWFPPFRMPAVNLFQQNVIRGVQMQQQEQWVRSANVLRQQLSVNINFTMTRNFPSRPPFYPRGFSNMGTAYRRLFGARPGWFGPPPLLPASRAPPRAPQEDPTPSPSPRPPRLKASSWAEVKAKLANSVEIITLDQDEEEEEERIAVQPEDCKSLGTILNKLQIFQRASGRENETPLPQGIKFDVFLPNPTFKKSSPGRPAYHVIVNSPADVAPLDTAADWDDVPLLYALAQPDTVSFFTLRATQLPTVGS